MYTDGQIITEKEYIDFVNWANANGCKFYIDMNEDGTYTVREAIVVEPTEEEKARARITELKQLLADADYWTSKRIDGEYTEEEWAEKVAIRKAWREEINQLEGVI